MKRRALISVYDKTGIVDFCGKLVKNNFEIISTSGTAKLLQDHNISCTEISTITSYPEILGGRVKTLHPIIFAGILADKNNEAHAQEITKTGIGTIDLVVVNLYPFEQTITKPECTVEEAIEQIDIGGVSLIRAAAKNFSNVSVLVNPSQYSNYSDKLDSREELTKLNAGFASEAFRYIANYDACIAEYFDSNFKTKASGLEDSLLLNYPCSQQLRYGENPHQKARLYFERNKNFNSIFEKLHGKELSYNNILDINAAYNLIREFKDTTIAIIKHSNPCGIASDKDVLNAYRMALATDSVSAFGGIIIVNKLLDYETSVEIDKIFSEVVIAPEFGDKALELLTKKRNRRLIKYNPEVSMLTPELKSVSGGLLVQEPDEVLINESEIRCVTDRKPSDEEYKDLLFAMKAAKHTKSNAVIYVKNLQTLGIGGGQPSRVDSSNLAVEKATRYGFDLTGSAVASDAFFPFADGVVSAAKAGARSVIQPGGSVRDDEVIRTANEYGLAMLLSGIRHFKH